MFMYGRDNEPTPLASGIKRSFCLVFASRPKFSREVHLPFTIVDQALPGLEPLSDTSPNDSSVDLCGNECIGNFLFHDRFVFQLLAPQLLVTDAVHNGMNTR